MLTQEHYLHTRRQRAEPAPAPSSLLACAALAGTAEKNTVALSEVVVWDHDILMCRGECI